MNTADWWMLEMMARVSEHPVMTHGECLEKAIPEIQREAAEEMREMCASVSDEAANEKNGLVAATTARCISVNIRAMTLPGDEVEVRNTGISNVLPRK